MTSTRAEVGRSYWWPLHGCDRAEEYGARNGVPGELLVKLTPTNIVSRRRRQLTELLVAVPAHPFPAVGTRL
jgi:hypothetical protein